MPSAKLEIMTGVIRLWDKPDHAYDDYYCVLNVVATGPACCTIFALNSWRRLKRPDFHEIKKTLIEAGYSEVRGWRRENRKVRFGARVIDTCNGMALWAVNLAPSQSSQSTSI
ncbi:MAG: hypothetical protein CTY18_03055 [Methylomonas sp.]|nr:MAG: hypothetical protein CTY18_03055 [Methylomonas sp.]